MEGGDFKKRKFGAIWRNMWGIISFERTVAVHTESARTSRSKPCVGD